MMLVAGSMIGSGIFISSDMGTTCRVAYCYVVLTGLLTVVAAVSYGELSAMFPKAVGNMYIKEGKAQGFVWLSFRYSNRNHAVGLLPSLRLFVSFF
jgi:APA family basic amino acid/polyamine antiporter